MVASSAAKPRRLGIGRTPSPSRPLRREGARACAHHAFVQERLLPGGRLNNRRAWATRWVGHAIGRILGRLRASFSLFAFALRDRGQISVAVDGLLAHVFPATEQEYCKRDRDHCAQYGAKRPIPCPVV